MMQMSYRVTDGLYRSTRRLGFEEAAPKKRSGLQKKIDCPGLTSPRWSRVAERQHGSAHTIGPGDLRMRPQDKASPV